MTLILQILGQFDNLFLQNTTSMAMLSTSQFLGNIDADLLQYTDLLLQKGYTNTRMLAHLTFQDIPEIPIGHK